MLIDLDGKVGLVVGIANEHSIAWGCAKQMHECKAKLAVTYGSEKTKQYTKPLTEQLNCPIFLPGNVEKPEEIQKVFAAIEKEWGKLDFLLHAIAFAPQQDLHGRVVDCSKEGFLKAMDISCYSLIQLSKLAEPLMKDGGSILTVSYYGSQKVIKNYNVMGVAKAALESTARYLANDLGTKNIRVNVLSPGPIMTRAASGISDFKELLDTAVEKSPLHRGTDINSVGNLAAFLVSDLSKDITGDVLYVDAGYSIIG
jgi:enoyl-[acyl-carrier protein] reductase I